MGVGEDHPAQPDHRGTAAGGDGLTDVGQPLLQVAVARPDDRDRRVGGGQLGSRRDEAGDAHERVLGWRVAVGRGEVRGTLHVGHVVRAPAARAEEADAQLLHDREELVGLGEVDSQPGAVASERIPVRALRRGPTDAAGARFVGNEIEDREAQGHGEVGHGGPNPLHGRPQEVRAPRQVAAVAPRPIVGGEELVTQVAVAGLHVDEVEPGGPGRARPHARRWPPARRSRRRS